MGKDKIITEEEGIKKPLSKNIRNLYEEYKYIEAYVTACKEKKFIRIKTIAKAILKRDRMWTEICEAVENEYPELKDMKISSISINLKTDLIEMRK